MKDMLRSLVAGMLLVGCPGFVAEGFPEGTIGAEDDLRIVSPRCEGVREPIGIACARPRFSWGLAGTEPSVRPSGAEVRVVREDAVVWSKRTDGDLFACEYAGVELEAGAPYRWQVRLVNADGTAATDWCAPQRFMLALQTASDWEGARWIGEDGREVCWSNLVYEARFSLVKDAVGFLFRAKSETEGYMWQVNAVVDSEPVLRPHLFLKGGGLRILPQVRLNSFFAQGIDWSKEHVIRIEARGRTIQTRLDGVLVHACEDATFAEGTIGVRTSSGEEARVAEITVLDGEGKRLLHDSFSGHVLPAFEDPPLGDSCVHLKNRTCLHRGILPKNAPRLRKAFRVADKPIASAVASVCGLGFYELWLNGRKVDPRRVLAPGMRNPARAALFDTYDVTGLLRAGEANGVGLWLAAGYSDDFSRYGWRWRKTKRAILHLAITYADGTRDVVVTDGSWRMTDASEVTRASIYGGETIDAGRRAADWCLPRGRGEGEHEVRVCPEGENPRLVANDAPPIRMLDPRRPVKIVETRPGVFVADFGQNRAGFVQVRVKGPKGTRIRVHTSELAGKDGNIDPWTNGTAAALDEFVLAGTGDVEEFVPRFTYHGFRYAEIVGWPGRPTEADLTGWAVHADVERTGGFRCDNEGLDRYARAATGSMLSNFMSYPTDCCMRGERTPCQMDSQAYEDAALQMFELSRYYSKWLDDIGAQLGNPDWTGDAVTLPGRLYRATGDRRVLEARYAGMCEQVEADARKRPDLIFPDGFGDWCAPNDGVWKGYFNDVPIVNTAIFCEMCRTVAEAAEVCGRADDAARYRALHARAKAAFHAKFYHADTQTYGDGSQTTAVLPLAFGIVPDAERGAVTARLLETIRNVDRSRVNVGIYGMRYLGDVLCDAGEADLFVHLMTQPEYPGFGFMFARGATTLWEQWKFRGGMNSHNHAMFSGAFHALMTRLAGIRVAAPGAAALEIRPSFPKSIGFVEAFRETPRGRVAVTWRREGAHVDLDVEVPPFTPTALVLPGKARRILKAGRTRIHGCE